MEGPDRPTFNDYVPRPNLGEDIVWALQESCKINNNWCTKTSPMKQSAPEIVPVS